jgi:hypothetical protein
MIVLFGKLTFLKILNSVRDIWLSQHYLPTVTVSVEIGLFDLLNSHPDLNVEELSKQLQIGLRGLNALLVVLTSLKLLNHRKEKYQLSELAK